MQPFVSGSARCLNFLCTWSFKSNINSKVNDVSYLA